MKAILLGSESCPFVDLLRSKLQTHWDLVAIHSTRPEASEADFEVAEVLISVRYSAEVPRMPALRLLQAACAGTDNIRMDLVPAQATVCNAYGHQVAVAEYVILGMLACAHNLMPIHAGFKKGTWYWSGAPVHVTHSEVFGKTLCIVGFGRIGRETATRAKALGMRVIACNRSAITHEPDLDRTFELSKLAEAASRADFVLVSCALTNDTRNIIDTEVLAAMKATSVVINVGRGPLIHEEALYKALFERRIAGAVLDAWYRYPDRDNPQPPPSQFPFSQLDNVIMTPHVSGWTDGMVDRRWAEMASNLDRFALGRPLVNVVRPAQAGRQDDAPAMA